MKYITDKQSAVFKFIWQFLQENYYQPSTHDIMKKFGFTSPATVTGHLMSLEHKGFIKNKHKARALIFTDQGLYFLKKRRLYEG